jgi:transcriptional regulator with GAF, ATPase, and Fis domain
LEPNILREGQLAQIVSEPVTSAALPGTSPYRLLDTNGVRMRSVRAAIDRVAPTDATVLITGESGTGKELVARAVHERSPRNNRPFVKVNCAALPADLLESELFGYEQGAFTGAHRTKPGKFELANGGTILLDEIGDLPITLQAKLLQVLQDGEFSPLGSRQDIRADVRVIAATNKDLDALVAADHFRHDLYYRINVMRIDVPPLRERPDEISVLLAYFLDKYAAQYGLERFSVSDETACIFMKYSWPGNVRELENCVKRLVVLGTEDWVQAELGRRLHGAGLDPAPVPPMVSARQQAQTSNGNGHDHANGNGNGNGNGHAGLRDISRKAALQAEALALRMVLDEVHWHRAEAAKRLKVSYRTLLSKIKQHGLEVVVLCALISAAVP